MIASPGFLYARNRPPAGKRELSEVGAGGDGPGVLIGCFRNALPA
jgi:hypothetical protein